MYRRLNGAPESFWQRRPLSRADNLTTFICRLFWNLGSSSSGNFNTCPSLFRYCFIFTFCYYARRNFLARIYATLVFTRTIFSPSSVSLSLNPFNLLAYCPLHSSPLLGLWFVYIISILFRTMLQNLFWWQQEDRTWSQWWRHSCT